MLNQILATTYTYSLDASSAADAAGLGAIFITAIGAALIPALIIAVVTIIGLWKLFEKAGYDGWKAIIPFYNSYILTEMSGQNGLMFLIMFIPLVGPIIWAILVATKLAPAFGKGTGFAIGLVLLTPIFYCILGFGNAQYQLGTHSAESGGPAPQDQASAPQEQTPPQAQA